MFAGLRSRWITPRLWANAVARATGEYKLASNWIQQDVLRSIKEKKTTVAEFPVRPEGLADLVRDSLRAVARRAELPQLRRPDK